MGECALSSFFRFHLSFLLLPFLSFFACSRILSTLSFPSYVFCLLVNHTLSSIPIHHHTSLHSFTTSGTKTKEKKGQNTQSQTTTMLRTPNSYRSSGSTVGSTNTPPSVKRSVVSSSASSPTVSSSSTPDMGADLARKRQIRKDDAIRKKLDQELGRKKPSTRAHRSTKPVQGTVGSLR